MYAGQETDSDTGLTYHLNRWRNEEGDAFISEDPICDGSNWYTYGAANPVMMVDKDGLKNMYTWGADPDVKNNSNTTKDTNSSDTNNHQTEKDIK